MKNVLRWCLSFSLLCLASGSFGFYACSTGGSNNNQADAGTQEKDATQESTSSIPANLDIKATQMTKGKTYKVSYEPSTSDKKVPLNELYDMTVTVTDAQDKPVKNIGLMINACMPDHNHCMFVKPEVESTGDGKFKVKGLKFHMQGHWEIYMDITDGKLGEKECGRSCSCTSGDCALFHVWMEF